MPKFMLLTNLKGVSTGSLSVTWKDTLYFSNVEQRRTRQRRITMEPQTKATQEMRNVADFLRSSKSGMKTRVGVLNGKRVDYFKGASVAPLLPSFRKG